MRSLKGPHTIVIENIAAFTVRWSLRVSRARRIALEELQLNPEQTSSRRKLGEKAGFQRVDIRFDSPPATRQAFL